MSEVQYITTKCHALWAKLNHVLHIVIAGYDKLFLCLTSQ